MALPPPFDFLCYVVFGTSRFATEKSNYIRWYRAKRTFLAALEFIWCKIFQHNFCKRRQRISDPLFHQRTLQAACQPVLLPQNCHFLYLRHFASAEEREPEMQHQKFRISGILLHQNATRLQKVSLLVVSLLLAF